jgi:hypothetical protein
VQGFLPHNVKARPTFVVYHGFARFPVEQIPRGNCELAIAVGFDTAIQEETECRGEFSLHMYENI